MLKLVFILLHFKFEPQSYTKGIKLNHTIQAIRTVVLFTIFAGLKLNLDFDTRGEGVLLYAGGPPNSVMILKLLI